MNWGEILVMDNRSHAGLVPGLVMALLLAGCASAPDRVLSRDVPPCAGLPNGHDPLNPEQLSPHFDVEPGNGVDGREGGSDRRPVSHHRPKALLPSAHIEPLLSQPRPYPGSVTDIANPRLFFESTADLPILQIQSVFTAM